MLSSSRRGMTSMQEVIILVLIAGALGGALQVTGVLEAVVNGDADFGVNFVGSQDPTLDFRPLTQDRFVLVQFQRHIDVLRSLT